MDFSEIEKRVMSVLNEDQELLEPYTKGKNFYKEIAARVFEVPYEEVTDDQKKFAKSAYFWNVYSTPSNLKEELTNKDWENAAVLIKEAFGADYLHFGLDKPNSHIFVDAVILGIKHLKFRKDEILEASNNEHKKISRALHGLLPKNSAQYWADQVVEAIWKLREKGE